MVFITNQRAEKKRTRSHREKRVGLGGRSLAIHGVDLLPEHVHFFRVAARVGQRKEDFVASLGLEVTVVVVTISANATCEVHVLLLNRNAFGVNRTEVGVFEKTDDVGFSGFLEGLESLRLETQLVVHIKRDRAN